MLGALKVFFLIFIISIYSAGYAFFEIAEVMPNTTDDKNLEYITLKNISNSPKSLSGYTLADKKKQYIFLEDIFLEAGERKQFFRPETKLILNNSNEEIYLYNPEREKIDEVSYTKSIKGEFLSFEDIDIIGENSIISEEVYISGEIFISDEVILTESEVIIEEDIVILEIPEVKFTLQRPSYITQSGSTDEYICDGSKDECKINFDLRNSFSNEFPQRNYICDIDFGLGNLTGQEGRCNPNTIIFPQGEFEVVFKIFDEDDISLFSEKKIFVKNAGKIGIEDITDDVVENADMRSKEKTILGKIHITQPKIIIQSGLTGKGRYFYCEKLECKINLNYEKNHKNERCLWDFADGELSSIKTYTRCNPGYVILPKGVHELSLRVYEKNNEGNRKIFRFYVYNQQAKMQPLVLEKNEDSDKSSDYVEKEKINIEIHLQGKLSKEKTLSGSIVTCLGVERCYVNLEGIITPELSTGFHELNSRLENLEYIWKLDNEVFSKKLNPKGIWVEGIGEHEIILQVGEIKKKFIIILKTKSTPLDSISGTSFDKGRESIEFTQNYLSLKYDGLRISGKAPIGSKIEIYNNQQKILEGFSDIKGRYRLVSKNFIAGEYIFDTKIILKTGEEIFLENSGEFILKAEKRIYWFISKKSSSKKTKKEKIIKFPSLIIQTESSYDSGVNNEEPLSIGTKIFLILIICLVAIFGVLHIVFIYSGIIVSGALGIYQLKYLTKQKVLLCL